MRYRREFPHAKDDYMFLPIEVFACNRLLAFPCKSWWPQVVAMWVAGRKIPYSKGDYMFLPSEVFACIRLLASPYQQ